MQCLSQKLYTILMLINVVRLLSKKTVKRRNAITVHLYLDYQEYILMLSFLVI